MGTVNHKNYTPWFFIQSLCAYCPTIISNVSLRYIGTNKFSIGTTSPKIQVVFSKRDKSKFVTISLKLIDEDTN